MKKQWLVPKHWQDFEEMCHLLHKAEFAPEQIYRYGRAGQAQYGVDIAACSDRQWIGIQCKLKTELLGSVLTEQELLEEHEISKRFKPALWKLYIATTCPRDTAVQDLAARISGAFQRRHPVEVQFWDDLEDLLDRHPPIAKRFYPESFGPDAVLSVSDAGDPSITIERDNWDTQLELFLRHSRFCSVAGSQFYSLTTIVSELIDNAFSPNKGAATRVIVELVGDVLSIKDDGTEFDCVSETIDLAPQMKGIKTIRRLLIEADDQLSYDYFAKEPSVTRFNTSEFKIRSHDTLRPDPCSATGPVWFVMRRGAAFDFVNELSIPAHCEVFTLNLTGRAFFSSSAASQLVETLLSKLGGRKLRVRFTGASPVLIDVLRREAETHPHLIVEQC
jgi:hypothetical protein